jgi:hypothetical protein
MMLIYFYADILKNLIFLDFEYIDCRTNFRMLKHFFPLDLEVEAIKLPKANEMSSSK